MPIPQGLTDALNACQQAKEDADSAAIAKQQTAATVASAQAADDAAASDLALKSQSLDQRRKELEAIEDAYFQVGAPAPVIPVASA